MTRQAHGACKRHLTLEAAAVALALPMLAVCCTSQLDRTYVGLDEAIASCQEYRDNLESQIGTLRDSLKAADSAGCDSLVWFYTGELFGKYRYYQADSALMYLEIMQKIAGDDIGKTILLDCEKIEIYASMRDYSRAKSLSAAIAAMQMDDNQLARWYKADLYLDGIMAVDESIPEDTRKSISERRLSKRIEYVNCKGIDPFEKERRKAMSLYETGDIEESVKILVALTDKYPDDYHKAAASYSLAAAYGAGGNTTQRKIALAQSAIYSLRMQDREYLSLHELSNILFEENNLTRASRYAQVALADALGSKYNIQIQNSSNSLALILAANERQSEKDKSTFAFVAAVLTVLLLAVLALLFYTISQHKKIARINSQLMEANRIKERYIYRYIGLSAEYLKKIAFFKHDLRVALKSGDALKSIRDMVKGPDEGEIADYKEYYRIFDETFLGLFPDFIPKVNSMLREEARFPQKNGMELTTGLRILAAIKLGFTDSGQIAHFLNCAPTSVYTHRCKIKKAALTDKENFEERIRSI